ncbi:MULTISPECIES: STAS domain-containing protein [unclassified Streptomyces]|uniref:STAS domain-containing protein n=1 Tax=unclassified Streptomyces TaxID=2593676 RepID=UPI00224FE28A|nr:MULTISPECIES: STAS domain-containing protein [unclassified Streptomyces]MCX4993154.1 STAS domain-containing protein [Streptomyces sp. NBC_00568]MCX5001022.1 STAS domain-containing protein [Streptomyces sp. NBC_00638]
MATSGFLRQALEIGADGSTGRLVLDFSGVIFMDSSGISVLAAARRDAASAGGWIRMASLRAPARRVVEIVGLDTVIPCYPTLSRALLS